MANKSNGKDANQVIQDLRIEVTSRHYDDIGKILDQLGIKYTAYDGNLYDGKLDCDILFLNCGTSDTFDYQELRSFVDRGGVLYASDLTSSHLLTAWPEIMTVTNNTSPGTIRANIVDKDLRQYIGDSIDVVFDLSAWSRIITAPQGKVLMESASGHFPIMVEFTFGSGKVFYTSFHNHTQASEMERDLLQLLVIKQISAATDIDFKKTMDIVTLSSKPSGATSVGTSGSQIDSASSIIAKWQKKDEDKTSSTESMADSIKAKWRNK